MTGDTPRTDTSTGDAELMDSIYRWQRHIYDVTRKYYLFGRDSMLRALNVRDGQNVLEIGCGTGRNLAVVRRLWPTAQLYGLDISAEMLKSARARLGPTALLACDDASGFSPQHAFGRSRFDRIIMPYCTSMIPNWREAIAHAASLLAPEGSLHIVDFGDMASLPRPLRMGLQAWLARFHVTPRDDLVRAALGIGQARGLSVEVHRGPCRYFQKVVLTRPRAVVASGT